MAFAEPLPMQPNAPAFAWLGQKRPLAFARLAVPVVMGVRFTGNEGKMAAGGGKQS